MTHTDKDSQASAEQTIDEILVRFGHNVLLGRADNGWDDLVPEAKAQLQRLLDEAQANCIVEPNQPNHIHMNYFNIGYKKGREDMRRELSKADEFHV